ncbi:hypothetical protein HPB48_013000 [Haemaphysalis longicornis]|uniref:Quinolinate phosphoribosyltransferase [decarboxylating] n=1 Tax=Haemaphysalis longicornis TaxID=44386 RepID=A0A9J6GGH2_HAELO|nr:hypothetical protein HPB48_013000 [Haemaphysalis longicornis]
MAASILNPPFFRRWPNAGSAKDQPSLDIGLYRGRGGPTAPPTCGCKSPGVLAGVPFVNAVVAQLDCDIKWLRNEGEWLNPVAKVAEVTGQARRVLLAERVLLNCLARASGVASAARRMREALNHVHWGGRSWAGTRKDDPRLPDWSRITRCWSGAPTRTATTWLSMIMLKDNHLTSVGSIEKDLAPAAQKLKTEFPNVLIEASGGVTHENVTSYAVQGIDIISSSLLIQGYATVDFSLKVQPPKRAEDCALGTSTPPAAPAPMAQHKAQASVPFCDVGK